jgi:plasmid stability protein
MICCEYSKMRTTLDLPDELMRHLKARAALEGRSLRDLTQDLIERGLRAPKPERQPPAAVAGLPTVRLGRPLLLPDGGLSHAGLSELAQE